MNEQLIKFHITPRVVKCGTPSVIKVKALDEVCKFYDDMLYNVKITSKEDGWEYTAEEPLLHTGRINSQTISTKCSGGVISFEYNFELEGEYKINISPSSDKHIPDKFNRFGWAWHPNKILAGFNFSLYALEDDIYNLRPFKGDLHVHSSGSDGCESPGLTAAEFRKKGYDYISITDHYDMRPTYKAIDALKDVPTDFKLFPGEEVHTFDRGIFHVVNFNGNKSVNDMAHLEREKSMAEVEEIFENLDIENPTLRREIAWFSWINEKIHEAGGITILPHPYWEANGSYVVRKSAVEEIFKRRLFDVFEFYGGGEAKRSRMQAQLYYQYTNDTHDMPIVASSDCHRTLEDNHRFDFRWTITFARSADDIPDGVLKGNSVVVDNYESLKNIYGDLRLVKYAWFLVENYYGIHDTLCDAAGQAIARYVLGCEGQEALVQMLEDEIRKFNMSFFG